MPLSDENRNRRKLNDAFLAGEKILGIRFRHNSHVAFDDSGDVRREGWIVSVGPIEPQPVYTIERCDGGGDEDVIESRIELILDPHESPMPNLE